MSADLSSVIAATTRWLVRAYPTAGGVLSASLAEAQARQAVTVAAWLRYPTPLDAALVAVAGPGGALRLDRITGAAAPEQAGSGDSGGSGIFDDPGGASAGLPWIPVPREPGETGSAWRTWVDEVLASWAACLLTSPDLVEEAVAGALRSEHARGPAVDFRRLAAPDGLDRDAAPLLRHPDLMEPVAGLHRDGLLACLGSHRGPSTGAAAAD
ncbi:hypothetical protein IQ279_07370 [Streptomyces verrucosisporus]|uniref:hypothetical protein n=1 Tax=Streptomyces verrucosisporus TaxID=1695161 RepID=UPI0019D027E9|nr:hypothetical protein [Streptomyces verrucosisporus]MBN3929459.1 hypothetical protein [Streptomyces verrucosisporus]